MNSQVSRKITQEAMTAAQEFLQSLPQADHITTHIFSPGVYCRQVEIAADIILIGRIHRHETFNILLKGKIEIAMEDGGVTVMEAPHIFTSGPGVQKLIRTLSDITFLNIHPTTETDVEKLEEMFTVSSYEEYETFKIEQDKIKLIGDTE
jgi:hypothetical protein